MPTELPSVSQSTSEGERCLSTQRAIHRSRSAPATTRLETRASTSDCVLFCSELLHRDRNLPAAFCSLISIALIAAALGDQEWFYVTGGQCALRHIGATLFYGWGYFQSYYTEDPVNSVDGSVQKIPVRHVYYVVDGKRYKDCVTAQTADVIHALLGVGFVALWTALCQLCMDFVGVSKRGSNRMGFLRWLRRNAIFSIFSVILCVVIVGLAYWAALQIESYQQSQVSMTSQLDGAVVEVQFEEAFYMVVGAAVMSICAVAINLFKTNLWLRRRLRDDDRLRLLDNWDYQHQFSGSSNDLGYLLPGSLGPPPPLQMLLDTPPPPPYQP